MARKPVFEAALTVPLPDRQPFWTAMRARRRFTVAEIAGGAVARRHRARDYAERLTRAGILARVAVDDAGADVYEIARDPGPEAPCLRQSGHPARRSDAAAERMWRTMKMLETFTLADLCVAASAEGARMRRRAAAEYLRRLCAAGYVATVAAEGPQTAAVYRLVKRTGPLAPRVCRTTWVWDANLGAVMGQETR